MNRERRALVAFALLAALVLGPVAATSHHGAGEATARADQHRAGRPASKAAGAGGGGATRLPRFPNRKGPTPRLSVCDVSVPLYPGAHAGGARGNERSILHAVTRLGLTQPLTMTRAFAIPGDDWIGNSRTPEDVFQFYQRRMREVPVFRMGRVLRSLIGVRPSGEVDSPPLLYVDHGSAVVIRTIGKSEMGFLVAVACSRTV